ncbi:MAG: NAD(P)/FAD-dependent oxidoreductase [Rhodospirillaceae bacterium]|nr:NAD(P)/FAD-dependent oxidoreductase [Rhodospirillaceae bacterium]MBT6136778.1 NAD(P)/FAD-dependent oxidoreductase [Rhodospirillaceae bacterium]
MASSGHHRVVIAGGGTAGITVAASLMRRTGRDLDIAIVEPAAMHYYQPALTMVGAGAYEMDRVGKPMADVIPSGVTHIETAIAAFDPDNNAVTLADGERMTYDYLVVATGVRLDWEKVEGLAETLGKNGVCSNYSPDHAPYTWECVRGLEPASRAVFTQPPLPFKCPGAPQKAVYMTADYLKRKGLLKGCDVSFFLHGPGIFGVPFFAKELVKVAARYGVDVRYQHNLVAVDGEAKTATFEQVAEGHEGEQITVPFDMLHVSPPQSPHEFVRKSSLANAAGWVEVDQNSMRHARHENVFALGDVTTTPNSKTAAAVRKQAPVVVRNLLHAMAGRDLEPGYDGYASCPLTTGWGKAIIAEFVYGGKVTPTFGFLDPAKEQPLGWFAKISGLPAMYWWYMLRGYEWFPEHDRNFQE